jgi:hypothetical protein
MLFLGGPAEKADAQEGSRGATTWRGDRDSREFRRGRSDRGRAFDRRFDRFDRFDNRPFERRFSGRFDNRVFVRPYRTVRVFVYFPFPHWVLRRVYDDVSVVGPGCDPY